MLYSPDRGFVFIAVPKTGTTAIQNCLRRIDPAIMVNGIPDGRGGTLRLRNHATVAEIRYRLGDRAEGLRFIAFLRDPRAVVRSKYHFYRTGRAAKDVAKDYSENAAALVIKRSKFGKLLRVAVARLLPLPVWARLYPFKSSAHFIEAPAGRIAVDRLGRFEHLAEDFRTIFAEFGYDPADLTLSVVNETDYATDPAEDALLERIALRRLPRDMEIFALMAQGPGSVHA
ncbi:MAG TPA: hypothetical protein PKD10_00895 [Paracoccaceae bacterium]|nr:hypothetical protein [Paracoccaceae bacterium]HMO71089.1 hypothetical protein [Paracoccaceae bacterium]